MESPMKQAAKLLRDKKGGHRKLAVFLCLALLVTAGTVTAFVLNGQAQEHTRRVLECTAVHQHTESCYPDGDTSAEPVCGLADYAVHTHNDDCYDENGVLVCQLEEIEEHTHTDECYTRPLICGQQEFPAHVHTADCYADEDKVLICGEEEREPVAAVEGHTHTDACYETPRNLVCGEQERPAVEPVEGDPGYTHTEACYDENGELICGEEERPAVEPVEGDPGHTHTDACYEYGEPVLICGLEETEPVEADPGHTHTAECYQVKEGALPVCGLEETEGHTHTEACYGEPVLTCTKPEIELHTHTDECYETRTVTVDGEEVEEKVLICDKLQVEEHTHTEECFTIVTLTPEEVEELETKAQQPDVVDLQLAYEDENVRVIVDYDSTALLPEGAAIELVKADTPAPALDPSQMVVPEVPAEPAEGETPAEPAEGETPAEPSEGETPDEPAEGETPAEPAEGETPAEPAEGETPAEPAEGETPAEPAEGETPAEPAEGETPAEPAEGETPAEPSEGEAGLVRAGFVADGREWLPASTVTYTVQYLLDGEAAGEPVQYTYTPGGELPSFAPAIAVFTQTVETDEFIVTASYTALANLPAEAELRASLITDEDAVSDYAAQYREALNSSRARMQTLLDIGFWLGEEEVQPAAPVAITVQLLGEDGLPAGAPLTVVHFGENGPEVLPANSDDKGAAAFKMHSFSPVGIGQVPESDDEGRALLNDANGVFEWADPTGLYHVTFKVNGVVAPKAAEPAEPAEGETPDADAPEGEPAESEDEDETPSAPPAEGEAAAGEGEDGETEGETPDAEPETPDAEPETPEPADTTDIPLATAALLNFNVQMLGEEDEAFAAYAEAAQQDAGELLNLSVMRYSLTYGGVEMDLSNCEVEVTVAPTMQMQAMAAEYAEENPTNNGDDDGDGYVQAVNSDSMLPAPENKTEVLFSVMVPVAEDAEPAEGGTPLIQVQSTVVLAGANAVAAAPQTALMTTPAQTVGGAPMDAALPEDSVGEPTEPAPEMTAPVLETSSQEVSAAIAPGVTAAAAVADTFSMRAANALDPHFTVQYYAYLDLPATRKPSGASELPVIDTSGKRLPKNARGTSASPNDNAIMNLYVKPQGSRFAIATTRTLTEVYRAKSGDEWTYYQKPSIPYADGLRDKNYTLSQIWVLKPGCSPTSTNEKDWTVYKDIAHLHFTNRDLTESEKPAGETYIRITEGMVLRYVYEVKTGQADFKTAFYDYDITSGHIYIKVSNAISNSSSGKTPTNDQQNDTCYYAYTKQAGINSSGNYSGSGTRLAFGNVNTGTTLGENLWNGNLLNKFNGTQGGHPTVTGSYKGCTFGLVTGMTSGTLNGDGYYTNGQIQYAGGVSAPKLFNEGDATGKTSFDKYSLRFARVGDTYTLTQVNGTGTNNLDTFGHPSPYTGKIHDHIFTNDFWPMDSATTYGAKGHDLKFGSYSWRNNRAYAGSSTTGEPGSTEGSVKTFPYSDDGKDHNSYFGMRYEVGFELDGEYIGPLNYYFFGDDDMWVFLTKPDGTVELVCDIGGVHSSVGEYINLWDYIPKGDTNKGKYTLTFYYTERGASGSTCWMQFTLPSTTTMTPTQNQDDYGTLRVDKDLLKSVNGGDYTDKDADNGEEFKFLITFSNNGQPLKDDHKYTKYNKAGTAIAQDLVMWSGATFTLKDGEHIIIEYLPKGTVYTITELDGHVIDSGTVSSSNYVYTTEVEAEQSDTANEGQSVVIDGKTYTLTGNEAIASGSIAGNQESQVRFINKYTVYELPETGGMPAIVYIGAGAVMVMLAAGVCTRRKKRQKTADTSAR